MSHDDIVRFLRRAAELSKLNIDLNTGGPFGALIVKNGQIISEGSNLVTSTNDPTAHAEVVAIRKACRELHSFQLHGCVLFSSCEPCPMCLGAIYWARPDAVYYSNTREDAAQVGFDDAFIYTEIPKLPSQRVIPMIHLPLVEALDAFTLWKAKENKIQY